MSVALSSGASTGAAQETAGLRYLRLHERYLSLQGEGAHSGLPCYFIRFGGCDLRCHWCDTPAALSGGVWHSREQILAELPDGVALVQITGGEPLLQRESLVDLIRTLVGPGYGRKVILETGGHRSLAGLPPETHIVMDIKLPGSGETDHPFQENLDHLKSSDEIKFVVANRNDFAVALRWIEDYSLDRRFQLLVSPVWGAIELSTLARWILESGHQIRLQTQLHKHIWGPEASGV